MLKLWLRAANPFNAPRAMAEAQRAARVAAFALLASGFVSLVFSALMIIHPEWLTTILANQYTRMGFAGEGLETMMSMMSAILPMAMVSGIVGSVVIYGVLAWVQWKYATRAIPVVILLMTAYGAVMGCVGLMTGQYHGLDASYGIMAAFSWIVQTACAVLYVASLRGAFVLHRLKQEP